MASLPKWKAQLLERKRKDEEEGRRKEKEELERLAKIPAWKKEIMERRRTRLCSRPSQAEGQQPNAGWGLSNVSSSEADGVERPRAQGPEAQDGAVLQENIGPVNCNPFVRQEKQRREGDPEQSPRHWQLSSTNAGVRTIQVGNVTILEPECLKGQGFLQPTSSGPAAEPTWRGRKPGGPRQPVTDAPLTRSVEDLSSLGRGQEEGEGEGEPRRGRVSRLLSRFGQRRGFVARSHSTENILRRPSRPRNGEVPAPCPRHCPQPSSPSPTRMAVHLGKEASSPRGVTVFRSHFEAHPTAEASGDVQGDHLGWSSEPVDPELPSAPRCVPAESNPTPEALVSCDTTRCSEDQGSAPSTEGGDNQPAAAPTTCLEQSQVDELRLGADPGLQVSNSLGDVLLSKQTALSCCSPVPESQAQTQTEQSQQSSAPIPCQEQPPELGGKTSDSPQPDSSAASKLLKPQPISIASSSCAEPALGCLTVAAEAASCPAASDQGDAGQGCQAELGTERPLSPEPGQEQLAAEDKASMSRLYKIESPSVGRARAPATTQEEVRLPAFSIRAAGGLHRQPEATAQSTSERPADQGTGQGTEPGNGQELKGLWGGMRSSCAPQRKAGKTITINPRKMAANKVTVAQTGVENGMTVPPVGTQSPATPGKKRYPTAEEILVIGGYLSLRRSCLAKAGASRRKLNISFNDCELESTFEYPSELALLAEFGTDEEEVSPKVREPEEEEEEEEEALVPRLEVPGSPVVSRAIRRKPLLVDESCR